MGAKTERGEIRDEAAQKIGNLRLELVRMATDRLWKNNDLETIANKAATLRDEAGIDATPIYNLEDGKPNLLALGTGGMSTQEFGYQICLNPEWATIVNFIMSGSNNTESGAKKLESTYGAPAAIDDFAEWFFDTFPDLNHVKDPAEYTRIFFKEGMEVPPDEVLEYRLKIRKKYDAHFADAILDALRKHDLPSPQGISLRGYSFPITTELTNKLGIRFLEDTHPADLSFVAADTLARLYPGFLAEPVKNMRDDRHQLYRGSLISVYPISGVEDLRTVDAGEVLAMGQGLTPTDIDEHRWLAKSIQNRLKFTEDFYLIALHAAFLPAVMAIANKPSKVTYRTWDREKQEEGPEVTLEQKEVYTNKSFSGKYAFGQNEKDLAIIDAL